MRNSARQPTFSIVIPTYNRCDVVETTLRHLIGQNYPDVAYEVIIVDNSSDATPAMVRRVAAESPVSIRLIEDPAKLPAIKRNIGLAVATGDFVMFMNDDVWFDAGVLAEHARVHTTHERPIAVLGHIAQSPQMEQTPFIEFFAPFSYYEIDDRSGDAVPYRYFWTMHISLSRRVMIDRNLVFHEDWRHIGEEDLELGWRWCEAGYDIVYTAQARSEHFHPHTLASACRVQESIGRGVRDFEVLVDDPGVLERFGIFSWHNSARAVVRGLVRTAMFNRFTTPYAERYLESRTHNTRLTRWMYWKVLLDYTNRGYRAESTRDVARTITRPEPEVLAT